MTRGEKHKIYVVEDVVVKGFNSFSFCLRKYIIKNDQVFMYHENQLILVDVPVSEIVKAGKVVGYYSEDKDIVSE